MKAPVLRKKRNIVYRAHHPMWAYAPLSGDGAKKHGGRFNRPGNSALYTSQDPTTAWMEAQQAFPFKPQPMTLLAYEVNCADIADLNDQKILQSLGYNHTDLACPWEDMVSQNNEPPTWLLADQLQALGVAGIIIRSFAPGCTEQNQNLILWQWTDTPPHAIKVIDEQNRLPISKDSWQNNPAK